MRLNSILKITFIFIVIIVMMNFFVVAEEEEEEAEYLEWTIGFIGFIAAIIAAYTGVKTFGGLIGKSMKLYASGIILIGIASIMCFLFYIVGIGEHHGLSVQIEDTLRTIALIIFSIAGVMMYKNMKNIKTLVKK